MTIVWSPRPIRHLADLRAYIAQDNPRAASRVAVALLPPSSASRHILMLVDRAELPAPGSWWCQARDT